MEENRCLECHAVLSADDIGAHKKLICRGSTEFMCVPCLAKYFKVDEALIRKKIEEFRAAGCSLFR